MTALVGVLNKHGIAVAADSAVTMGGTAHKVVNTANKLFTLSKRHPVAVMIYNHADFMGNPWEVIVKEYRKKLADDCFDRLEDYVTDFVRFLRAQSFYADEEIRHMMILQFFDSCYNQICHEYCQIHHSVYNSISEEELGVFLDTIIRQYAKKEKNATFHNFTFDDFCAEEKQLIDEYNQHRGGLKCFDKFIQILYYCLVCKGVPKPIESGLVFVGYGDKEIYPSLWSLEISIVLHNELIYSEGELVKIGVNGLESTIRPFAQCDVTHTILRGVNPTYEQITRQAIDESLRSVFNDFYQFLAKSQVGEDVLGVVQTIDTEKIGESVCAHIRQNMQNIYTNNLLSTLGSLGKEDMANMAESFISLTSLVRRMQPGEQTVGGPVDVAVLSKGDGFIWIKRKHYFDSELNHHFFENYYK